MLSDDLLRPDWLKLAVLQAQTAELRDRNLSLDSDAGHIEISVYRPGVFRLRAGRRDLPDYGLIKPAAVPLEASIDSHHDHSILSDGRNTLEVRHDATLTIALKRQNNTLLSSGKDAHFVREHRLPPFCHRDGQWFGAFELQPGEPVYGLGEKWGALNKRGQLMRSFAEDALGVNSEISYKNSPFLWSPRGWGILFNTPATLQHAVGFPQWSNRAYAFLLDDAALDVFFIVAETGADILKKYAELTGFAPEVPRWSLGCWMSRAYYKTADELLDAAQTLRTRQLPCDVITLDGRAWLDTATRFAFEWDAQRYPDPRAVTDRLHELGFKVCVWEYPLVSVQHPLFQQMAANGWLLKNPHGEAYRYQWDPSPFGETLTPLPTSGIVDFTHPEAYAYWRDRHQDLFDSGIDVIKSDFGEQVPMDALACNGDSGRRLHNVYPLLYNRCVYEASQHRFGRSLVFARSGWLGSQNYPAQWGGDPQADWGGLAGSLAGGLSWALSGNPCYASDIGGFYGDRRDSELFIRWTQLAVFASHMRFHGIGLREPWSYEAPAEAIAREFVELRYRLLPYIEHSLREASQTGMPLMRAMVLACPDDSLAWAFEQQFMFGADLFVAPVLQPGGHVRYYLPQGDWVDFWTRRTRSGGVVIEETVALERIPLYVRVGTRLELGPVVRNTDELTQENRVCEVIAF
jgi:alpha-D-xyloside xylohydrolase